jgi:hypothetical protein
MGIMRFMKTESPHPPGLLGAFGINIPIPARKPIIGLLI